MTEIKSFSNPPQGVKSIVTIFLLWAGYDKKAASDWNNVSVFLKLQVDQLKVEECYNPKTHQLISAFFKDETFTADAVAAKSAAMWIYMVFAEKLFKYHEATASLRAQLVNLSEESSLLKSKLN